MDFYVPFFKYPDHVEYENIKSWKVIDIKYKIRTGDVLLFSSSNIISSGIKFFTASRWNHAGMVCWLKVIMKDGSSKIDLYCFELGSCNFTDLVTRNIVDKGIRLVRLADIALMYDLIAVRRLSYERPPDFAQKYQQFILKWIGKPFIKSFTTLARAYLLYPGFPDGEYTCVQFIAIMMDELGIYPIGFDASQLTPGHYIEQCEAFPKELFLGQEIVLFKDNRLINNRMYFIMIIIIILVLILFLIYKRRRRR